MPILGDSGKLTRTWTDVVTVTASFYRQLTPFKNWNFQPNI
jgi:hypothetical protein